jgi:hypothetical protein
MREHRVPLCVECDETLESEADRSLVLMFREAVRQCRRELSDLAGAAGGPDFDVFQKLMRQNEASRLVCIELLVAMDRQGARKELKIEAKQSLIVRFEEAVLRYGEDVTKLAAAAGTLELDAFEKLVGECARSHEICRALLSELTGRE